MQNPDSPTVASVENDGDICRVSGALDFTTAGRVLAEVTPLIEQQASLSVNLDGVTTSNSAGLVLMIEWLGIARRTGHTVSFSGVPDGLTELARVCQVQDLIKAA